jgi:hypothetical protein
MFPTQVQADTTPAPRVSKVVGHVACCVHCPGGVFDAAGVEPTGQRVHAAIPVNIQSLVEGATKRLHWNSFSVVPAMEAQTLSISFGIVPLKKLLFRCLVSYVEKISIKRKKVKKKKGR